MIYYRKPWIANYWYVVIYFLYSNHCTFQVSAVDFASTCAPRLLQSQRWNGFEILNVRIAVVNDNYHQVTWEAFNVLQGHGYIANLTIFSRIIQQALSTPITVQTRSFQTFGMWCRSSSCKLWNSGYREKAMDLFGLGVWNTFARIVNLARWWHRDHANILPHVKHLWPNKGFCVVWKITIEQNTLHIHPTLEVFLQ